MGSRRLAAPQGQRAASAVLDRWVQGGDGAAGAGVLGRGGRVRSADGGDGECGTRGNLVAWLRTINGHAMPKSNWLWFRVLVNLALVRVLGVPLEKVKKHIDESLEELDSFYLGQGWSSDGLWCEERKQADYYSGSFAIQFAQLLYVRFAPDYDATRTERYKEQAREFARSYWRYFGPSGAAIPFGRSLTYRFAFAAFWSAAVAAGIELPAPVDQMGVVKGLLARHLRWWAQHPDIFNTDGTLNIGYAYPNMYLAEDYNSPQSVYWCLKSLIVVGLPETHPFWSCDELPYPELNSIKPVELISPPKHILCNNPEHHFLLSSGQSTTKRFKAREAKYGKFAYSSAFGFSVPCSTFLEQIAPDSTLAVSFDDGEEHWKVRWDPYDVQTKHVSRGGEEVPILVSTWRPWRGEELSITTALIPPVSGKPGWHTRVHRVQWKPKRKSAALRLVDGGFAASAQTSGNMSIFEKGIKIFSDDTVAEEGWYKDNASALVVSELGSSGVAHLTPRESPNTNDYQINSTISVIRADPNTNIVARRSLIPAVHHTITPSSHDGDSIIEATFVTGIFAVETFAEKSADEIWRLWRDRPEGSSEISVLTRQQ
ncbi:hypothetical protein OPT61_g8503 [Boeremia exigua]|uniref:Uncharacterized protein n=1 Tax=Boeremia exigua TaxID=749465 RepID=A0ACC2HYF1_9PLEO|nr:hypothetical protein OPT61_g8503 [Boeremia exigua]